MQHIVTDAIGMSSQLTKISSGT